MVSKDKAHGCEMRRSLELLKYREDELFQSETGWKSPVA